MASWGELLVELIPHKDTNGKDAPILSHDQLRNKYLQALSAHTGRNVIAYYSGWLKDSRAPFLDITDNDMTGFMQCLQGIDCKKGLDLILHTPGGNPTAAEGIVNYLHAKFNDDIRVIVPHMAMSAGTMLACASKVILMGKHSCLGPIDPQYNNVPAYNIRREYLEAKGDLDKNKASATYWKMQLDRYPCAFFYTVSDAIELSWALTEEWLRKYMFKGLDQGEINKRIRVILSKLNNNNKSHSRHFGFDVCKGLGLNVEPLESDNELQDLVLSVHHAFTITFDQTNASKIVENQLGSRYLNFRKGS